MGSDDTGQPDLAVQRPGHSVLAKLADLHARLVPSGRGPVVTVEEVVPWAVGYLGEAQVGERLAGLDGRWRVLHAVPLGVRGKDVDHLLIGPAGVFAINTKHHLGARVTVKGRDALYVNGTWRPYLKDARRDATAVRDLLTPAGTVDVQAVVCLVGARLTVTTPGEAVHVVDVDDLIPWLTGLPDVLDGELVDRVYVHARHADTWPGSPVPAAPDGTDALARELAARVLTPAEPPLAEPAAARKSSPLPTQRTRRSAPPSGRPARSTPGSARARQRDRASSTRRRRGGRGVSLFKSGLALAVLLALVVAGPDRVADGLRPLVDFVTRHVVPNDLPQPTGSSPALPTHAVARPAP